MIVSNQVSFLEFIFLEMAYGPVFTAIATRNGKYGLRKIGMFELPFYAIGIKFPREELNEANFFTDITALRNSLYVKNRPIVVFPEGTKTNGRGILHIEDDIIKMIASCKEKVHTLRFDYDFQYASPYNSTDVKGFKTVLKMLTQLRNSMLVQYYFNVEEKLSNVSSTIDPGAQYQILRSTMMSRGKMYGLKLTYK